MKTEAEIRQEIEVLRKEISITYNNFLQCLQSGMNITSQVHWDTHNRLMGFRDALQWMLKDAKSEEST